MKNLVKMMFVFALMLGVVVLANAQAVTTGTVNFDVTVPNAFDLRSDGPGSTNDPSAVTLGGATTANQGLGATITIADASPNQNNAVLTASLPIRMRSNATYKLLATRTGASVPSAIAFESSDIKMGITYSARSGANVNTGGSDTVESGWSALTNSVGDLGMVGIKISGGDRISNGGNNLSTDNFNQASLNFSVARAYYTPINNYTDQVTVAIVAGP